jgi:hypothetical protein
VALTTGRNHWEEGLDVVVEGDAVRVSERDLAVTERPVELHLNALRRKRRAGNRVEAVSVTI